MLDNYRLANRFHINIGQHVLPNMTTIKSINAYVNYINRIVVIITFKRWAKVVPNIIINIVLEKQISVMAAMQPTIVVLYYSIHCIKCNLKVNCILYSRPNLHRK